MRKVLKQTTAALMLIGTLAMSMAASAGPVPANLASVGQTAPQPVTHVRWRRYGGGVAAGIAAGIITGAIIAGAANPYYYGPGPYYYGPGPGYYDGPGYYYGPPPYYYGPRYYYRYRAPVYVAPPPVYYAPRRGGCWISTDSVRGYGYWGPC